MKRSMLITNKAEKLEKIRRDYMFKIQKSLLLVKERSIKLQDKASYQNVSS